MATRVRVMPDMMKDYERYHRSYPVFTGDPVTQGHEDYCLNYGHSMWLKDGEDTGVCPRCGKAQVRI